jgi:hypothetical protein
MAAGMVALALVAAGCAREPNVDKVPIGTDVQLTRDDGAFVEGTLSAKSDEAVKVDVGPTTKTVPRERIASVRVVDESTPPEPPPMAKFREMTIPAGTKLDIELTSAVSSESASVGDTVAASLSRPITVDGVETLPAGSTIKGSVAEVKAAGKVKGRASLALAFTNVVAHDEVYPIDARFEIVAPATKKKDAQKIGIPAAGGAIVGGILGGGKGAAIGAAIGGGAGTTAVLMTPGEEVRLPRGTSIHVTTTKAVDVKVPIKR